jgi:hypothetical protein
MPPPPTPGVNSPSSSFGSSKSIGGKGVFLSLKLIGENSRFSGLISLLDAYVYQ